MKDISLSDEELGTLLGDKESGVAANVQVDTPVDVQTNGLAVFKKSLERSNSMVKSSFSEKLGQETDVVIGDIGEFNTVTADGASQWYVGQGSFSNNGHCGYLIVFPDVMAHEFSKQFTGIADLGNNIDQVAEPLKELSGSIIKSVASGFENNFSGSIGDFELHTDLSQVVMSGNLLRVTMKIGNNAFYQFFDSDILSMLIPQKEIIKDADPVNPTNTNPVNLANADSSPKSGADNADGLSDLLSVGNVANVDSNEENAPKDIFASMDSLGESLLQDGSPVSNVKFSEFNQDEISNLENKTSTDSKKIDMLMDVSVDVVVELGHTKRSISEVLDLSRGSILDLNKLAGEPLDIKVNNKLVAKGEVVVIDENFGVRIVEILSPQAGVSSL